MIFAISISNVSRGPSIVWKNHGVRWNKKPVMPALPLYACDARKIFFIACAEEKEMMRCQRHRRGTTEAGTGGRGLTDAGIERVSLDM